MVVPQLLGHPPAWQTLRFPLVGLQTDQSGRQLDVGDIFSLVVFFVRPGAPAAFEIDNVRLDAAPSRGLTSRPPARIVFGPFL